MATRKAPARRQSAGVFGLATVAGIALLGIVLIIMAWATIPPGYVGIVFDKARHRVTSTVDPGWVFVNPFSQSITIYPVGIQTLIMVRAENEGSVQGDDSVLVGSKEGQTMRADVAVQYSVDRSLAPQLFATWAGAPIERIEENLVRQVMRSALNDVASRYGWEDIYGEKRLEYTQAVSDELQRRFAEKFVKFEALNLRGWHLPENLEAALATKIGAQQAAQQQSFALSQARIKAQQDAVVAKGEADALRARAQGEADATKIRARAQAEANTQLAGSLTDSLIQYEQLQRWNGKLPVFNGGGQSSFADGLATTGQAAP